MEILVLAGVALVIFTVWFIAAPLLRSEDEIQPLYRSRPGARPLSGSTGDETSDSEYGPLPEKGRIRCQHCGTVSDTTYDYCGGCLEPLT